MCKKKLMEKTNWYKRRKASEPEEGEKDQVGRMRDRERGRVGG